MKIIEKQAKQQAELHSQLWAIANDLRGNMDASEFKNYISKTDINTESINEIILKIIDAPEKKPFYRRLEER